MVVWDCFSCSIVFPDKYELREHRKTAQHLIECKRTGLICNVCNEDFICKAAFYSHCENRHQKGISFQCIDCDKSFPSSRILEGHLSTHKYLQRKKKHTCDICHKTFTDILSCKAHYNKCSKPFECLGKPRCTRRFKQISGMINHLESGACKTKIDRHKIEALVRRHDKNNALTLPAASSPVTLLPHILGKLSTSIPPQFELLSDSDSDSDVEVIMTPTSTEWSEVPTPSGSDWDVMSELYTSRLDTPRVCASTDRICCICGKKFGSPMALEMHLASPVHAKLTYHCPLSFLGLGVVAEERSFKTLGGLVSHVESGVCRMDVLLVIVGYLETLRKDMGLSGFKLIVEK